MKPKRNRALRELRKIIGLSQAEFAVLIGASKDAVASWKIGHSRVSPPFARRMALATAVGTDGRSQEAESVSLQNWL